MKLTSQEEYGLRCLLQVARNQVSGPVPIRAIAEAEGLSVEYTAKLLRVLRQGGLLDSVRGANGGYTLVGDPAEVTVWHAMQVLDTPLYSDEFCTGHSGQRAACVHSAAAGSTSCSIRVLWQWVDSSLRRALERVTLADLMGGASPVKNVLDGTSPEPAPAAPSQPQEHR